MANATQNTYAIVRTTQVTGQAIDTITFGYAGKAANAVMEAISSAPENADTQVRRAVRNGTGSQAIGQDLGLVAGAVVEFLGPKKVAQTLQLATKVLPATKLVVVSKNFEALGVEGVVASKAGKSHLAGLDLAEVNHQLPNVGVEFGRRPKGHIRTNEELIQDIATRAEREIGGSGRIAGIKKHTYSKKVIEKYQEMFGDRGIQFERNWRDKEALKKGESTKGSVRLDTYDEAANIVYDYKYVQTPGKGLKNDQVRRIKQNLPDDVQVIEVNPIKIDHITK